MTDAETIRYTADAVVFAATGHLLLIERGWAPYQGRWALPGGHVEPGETSRATAARELAEETGLFVAAARLRQAGVYDTPDRDPRGRYVTAVYTTTLPAPTPIDPGDDAADARWWPLTNLPPLAFDHAAILTDLLTPTP
ncbi:NUDIX domain-containing protein [Allonocardiopsis opalescens]|uniref:8-oxo-dGTP diphosphatase n=1 Tax=Allonocardiopsis opalescens TaxID=1144618 RepID=A0A2T0Q9A1_9ACTN|nr:NUDIX hydrolase [Allonocardiopsis opalescens]PRY00425.1 8-oxo-dGTP diphosphatase [Allonocardiopsis opalescens]